MDALEKGKDLESAMVISMSKPPVLQVRVAQNKTRTAQAMMALLISSVQFLPLLPHGLHGVLVVHFVVEESSSENEHVKRDCFIQINLKMFVQPKEVPAMKRRSKVVTINLVL